LATTPTDDKAITAAGESRIPNDGFNSRGEPAVAARADHLDARGP
jgi:hypothetical protein